MRPKPLSIVILSVILLVCVVAADVFINQKAMMKEQNYSDYVAPMSPERQVHEYIQAYTQNNQMLLEALTGAAGGTEFEYRQEIVYPSRLVSLQPNDAQREDLLVAGVYDAACLDAEIEFISNKGALSLHGCTFTFQRQNQDTSWIMTSITYINNGVSNSNMDN